MPISCKCTWSIMPSLPVSTLVKLRKLDGCTVSELETLSILYSWHGQLKLTLAVLFHS